MSAGVVASACLLPGTANLALVSGNAEGNVASVQVSSPPTTSPTGYSPHAVMTYYDFPGYPTYVQDKDHVKVDGGGQIIAIISGNYDPYIAADLAAFDKQYNLPILGTDGTPCKLGDSYDNIGCFQVVYANGSKPKTKVNETTQIEDAIDVEWAHAAAPGADIVLVEGPAYNINGAFAAINKAVSLGATVVSMSFTNFYMTPANADHYFDTPSSTGFVAAVGEHLPTAPTYCQSVSYPAGSPYVLAVGGTVLGTTESVWPDTWGGVEGGHTGPTDLTVSRPGYQLNWNPYDYRAIPDVSLNAVKFSVYASLPSAGWIQASGTSVSAPVWAGLVAEADQVRHSDGKSVLSGSGLVAAMYLAAGDNESNGKINPAYFNDITHGSSGDCDAAPGFDLPTGLGTPDARDLIDYLGYDV